MEFVSQLVCIGQMCSDYSPFTVRHYTLPERLIHQGYRYSDLCRTFYKLVRRHREIITINTCKCVEDGLCLSAVDSVLSCHVK